LKIGEDDENRSDLIRSDVKDTGRMQPNLIIPRREIEWSVSSKEDPFHLSVEHWMLTEASVDYSHKSSITSKHVTRAALPACSD